MRSQDAYQGGENFDLRRMLLSGRHMSLADRLQNFQGFLQMLEAEGTNSTMRCMQSAADREVDVFDAATGRNRRMLMFGSNNYLGLARHPRVLARMAVALDTFGAGVGGPPLLNGHTALHRELEERLAALKGTESALLFASGYAANVGLVHALAGPDDVVVYDEYSHASFTDGLKLAGICGHRFRHNSMSHLAEVLRRVRSTATGEVFVGVEGVYSMDGDLAPLDTVSRLCDLHGATLLLDDAHGTGVTGQHGHGTCEHCGLEGMIPVVMGTLSKTFAVTGGFVAGSRALVDYLRYFARSYMFSASLPPASVAAALAGLDVLAQEPERLAALRDNVRYASAGLRRLGFDVNPEAAIIPLRAPEGMDVRRGARMFHERDIFVNSIEYPAVPVHQQRFRISIMAPHTRADIDRLLTVVEEVWASAGTTHPAKPLAA